MGTSSLSASLRRAVLVHSLDGSINSAASRVRVVAPPPPAVRAGGAGGLVLPGETAAHASETLAYSGICVRHANNSIRKGAFEGELSSGASVLRVSVQQFRAVLPSSSGAAPRPSSTAGYDLLASCSCLLPLVATGATCQPDQPARAPTRRTPHPHDACATMADRTRAAVRQDPLE